MSSKVAVSGGIFLPWLIYEAVCLIHRLSRRPWLVSNSTMVPSFHWDLKSVWNINRKSYRASRLMPLACCSDDRKCSSSSYLEMMARIQCKPTGWAKRSGPRTRDHNSVKSESIYKKNSHGKFVVIFNRWIFGNVTSKSVVVSCT